MFVKKCYWREREEEKNGKRSKGKGKPAQVPALHPYIPT
jgi:hypothetical protein